MCTVLRPFASTFYRSIQDILFPPCRYLVQQLRVFSVSSNAVQERNWTPVTMWQSVVTALLEYLDLCAKFELNLPKPLHKVQFTTVRYICNCCLLFAHWFPTLQYNVNDTQFVFYQNGPEGARERAKGAKAPLPPHHHQICLCIVEKFLTLLFVWNNV